MVFEVQFLALATQVKADEVTQVFQGKLTLDLEFEGKRSLACLLYTSPSPRDRQKARMPSSA